jgi:NAD+ diphosphatase
MPIAFISSPLDRQAATRTHKNDLINHPEVQVVKVSGDQVAMRNGKLDLDNTSGMNEAIFLGRDDMQRPWFATQIENGSELHGLRAIMLDGRLPPAELSILAQARSLVHWHERHGFCANCGAKTEMQDAGYRRVCGSCQAEHFPRTDPVAIMAVVHKQSILLGRQKSWPPGMYSALAGFIEPGETMEQAVRREVFEEAGSVVGEVRYVASQPWPFPSSLMIGAIGFAERDTLKIDETELETARWFGRGELELMMSKRHPDNLSASHPYAIAHLLINEAMKLV